MLPGSGGYWGAMAWKFAHVGGGVAAHAPGVPGRQAVALSGRLWALLGLLALSPLLSELAFSMWDIRAYTLDGTDEMIDAAFYTLLPFVFVSAIALLFAAVLLSRHQALSSRSTSLRICGNYTIRASGASRSRCAACGTICAPPPRSPAC